MNDNSEGQAEKNDRVALGLVFWGWGLLLFLSLSSLPLANEMTGSYGGDVILVRPWMQIYNTVLLLAHLVTITAVLIGTTLAGHLLPDTGSLSTRSRMAHRGAIVFLVVTASALLTMVLFPYIIGSGPWEPDATEVALLRLLVFLPSVTRGAGWVLLVMALYQLVIRSESSLSQWLYITLVGLVLLDLGLSVWKWVTTPKAVTAVFHPYVDQPIFLIPWCLAGIIFLGLVRFRVPLSPHR